MVWCKQGQDRAGPGARVLPFQVIAWMSTCAVLPVEVCGRLDCRAKEGKGFGRKGEESDGLSLGTRGQLRVEPPACSCGMKQSMCWVRAVGVGGSWQAVGEEGKEGSREGSGVSLVTLYMELFRGQLFSV